MFGTARSYGDQPPIVNEVFRYKRISASGNVTTRAACLGGIFVSSASGSPTITVYDDSGTGTTTKVVDTFTPVAGQWYPLPFLALNGLNIVIGGTVSCTVAWREAN